jgi:hypothetical protein
MRLRNVRKESSEETGNQKNAGKEDEEDAALRYKTAKNIQKNYTATAQEKAVSRRRNLGTFRMPLTVLN